MIATEGQEVELRCFASGYPLPEIFWRRQDNSVLPNNKSIYKGNVLKFPSIRKEHRGTYFCVASNVVGVGARRNIDVEVKFAPSVKVARKRVGQALQGPILQNIFASSVRTKSSCNGPLHTFQLEGIA